MINVISVSNQDQEWQDHLDWMLENHPQRTFDLYRKGKLRGYLDKKAARANILWGRLEQEKKLPSWQAQAIVYHDLICPPDGPASRENAPTPLSEEKLNQIESWRNSPMEPNEVEITV